MRRSAQIKIMAKQNDIKNMPFEAALSELEDIVQKLESGAAPLEESIALYERGAALKAHCDSTLKAAQEKIEKIVADEAGGLKAEAADLS